MVTTDRHTSFTVRLRAERGVSLIHVAISIFVLTGFCAFVLDHGVLMLARGQSQNVADMAAIAGATSRAMDEPGDNPPSSLITTNVMQQAVNSHTIFGGTPANTGRDVYPNILCPPRVTGWCVKVDVFRDGDAANGSTALPVFFASLFGATDQKIKATATAVAATANGTRCLKPWIIPDEWQENVSPADEFNPPGDVYTPLGYTTADIGTPVLLKPGNPHQAISPSFFYAIDSGGGSNSATEYEANIVNCRITKRIGDTVNTNPGNMRGPTRQGVDQLTVDGPVDVIIALFSPVQFMAAVNPHGNFDLTIVNMMSVRLTGMAGSNVVGVITGGVGEDMGPGPTPTGVSSLIKTIQLVR